MVATEPKVEDTSTQMHDWFEENNESKEEPPAEEVDVPHSSIFFPFSLDEVRPRQADSLKIRCCSGEKRRQETADGGSHSPTPQQEGDPQELLLCGCNWM